MVLAGLDPLRDEALDFASRLIDAGVAVELHHYPDAIHGFDKVGDSAVGERSIHDRQCSPGGRIGSALITADRSGVRE